MKITLNVNNEEKSFAVKPNQTLMDVLRHNDYTEVKCGCNEGECGSCLVLLNEEPVNSCQVLAMSVQEQKIKTVKGIGNFFDPHLLQKKFVEAGADQCGFCTPGMVIASYSIMRKTHNNPTREEIVHGLDGNLCRCTGYVKIVDAVERTAGEFRQIKTEEKTNA